MTERRNAKRSVSIEKRDNGSRVISGYASVFYDPADSGTEYELWQGMKERIRPVAFNRALAEGQDVICAFNHDDDAILGRTKSGTCRLKVDSIGLKYEADIPNTTDGNDCAELVSRGDVVGSSFAFIVRGYEFETVSSDMEIRWITDVDLIDVGPVTFPAYAATTTSMRSRSDIEQERIAFNAERQIEADRIQVQKTLIAIDSES